jgi:hypothetical protein
LRYEANERNKLIDGGEHGDKRPEPGPHFWRGPSTNPDSKRSNAASSSLRMRDQSSGALSAARYVEPFSLLVAEIAYGSSGNRELAYRFEHFPETAD